MTLLAKSDLLPPFACRLLAKRRDGKGWRGLSHREIEQLSGLPKSTVAELSFRSTWKGVAIETVDAFAAACGVSMLGGKEQRKLIRRGKLTYTETGPVTQVRMYTKLWQLYAAFTAPPK